MAERWRASAEPLADLLAQIAANDAALSHLHQDRPAGVSLHLISAELAARGLDQHDAIHPKIADALKLPNFDRSALMVWPPPAPSLASLAQPPATPAGLGDAGADWWRGRD